MGEGQQQPHPLEQLRHRLAREHEAREQDVRQHEEEAQLHGLLLGPHQRRDEQPERQAGYHEDQSDQVEQRHVPGQWYVEHVAAKDQHGRHLDESHPDVGRDLPEHQLGFGDRCDDQLLQRAPLPLAYDRHRRDEHHGDREDHADEPWDDVIGAPQPGVVARPHAGFEGRARAPGCAGEDEEVADRGHARRRVDGRLGGKGVGRVHDHLQGGRRAAPQEARVVVGDHDPRLRVPLGDGPVEGGPAVHVVHDPEVPRVLERGDEVAAFRGAGLVEHDGRQVLHIGLDRVAEHQQLNHGQAHHDHERQPVAAHLDEFLAEHRPEPAHHRSSRSWRMMNASSRVVPPPPTCAATSAGVPRAIKCPPESIASRPQRSASSM